MSGAIKPRVRLSHDFQRASVAQATPKPKKRPAPFSIRLTPDERAYLEAKAGNRSLGAYIRQQLLGDRAEKRKHDLRRPQIDQEQYAALLAALGKSRLSSNLNQLAHAANIGVLDVSRDTEVQLQEAYACILEMRKALFISLGLKYGGDQ
ncbi:hypothetical protein QSV34_14350 [Porticoccus sp. W117]|uniref:plasmid mobilization protein n=1 Tax=Porticoccus sp. W117 TaxID=3054777 RepID=UPI002597415C|nr:hypothetical protein [Porticoccus sp. W117]MDM3872530.1 hypothetical protein [Porticoccus sp. W117]